MAIGQFQMSWYCLEGKIRNCRFASVSPPFTVMTITMVYLTQYQRLLLALALQYNHHKSSPDQYIRLTLVALIEFVLSVWYKLSPCVLSHYFNNRCDPDCGLLAQKKLIQWFIYFSACNVLIVVSYGRYPDQVALLDVEKMADIVFLNVFKIN